MLNTTTFVGLDVHARSIKAVALDAMTGEVRTAAFGYDAAEVAEWAGSLDPAAKCVYESGVTGFDLQKRLAALGVDCVVGAVPKMIKPSADRRRKNDRNDAEFPARMLSAGNVVEVRAPDDGCEAARDLVRAGRRPRGPEALQAAAVEVPPQARIRVRRDHPDRAQEGQLDRRALGVDKVDRVSREGRRRRPRALRRCRQAGDGGQEEAGETGRGRGLQAPMEEEGRLAALPEGRRRHDGRRHRVRGRRVLQVQERQAVRGVARAHALRALRWRERAAGRHHEGGQQASEEGPRRVGVALPWLLAALEGPCQGASPGPRGEKARGQGREKARREAARDARARRPQEQGQRRHRPRARVPVLGGGLHGRGRLGRNGRPSRHSAIHPILRPYPRPLGLTPGPFSASAQGAARDTRLSNRPRQPQP